MPPLTDSLVARRAIESALRHAIEAVDAEKATGAALERMGALDPPVTVLAVGKAAPAMARGAIAALGPVVSGGVVVSDQQQAAPAPLRSMTGSHPLPDGRSVAAGRALLEAAQMAKGTLLVLISGGGSALAEVPIDGLTIDDVARTQEVLLRSGVPIEEMNLVRRHMSELKNGGLLRASSVPVVTLLVCDVGSAPETAIASGPTLADGSAPQDAVEAIRRRGLTEVISHRVLEELQRAPTRVEPRTPHVWQVIVDGLVAAQAARSHLESHGVPVDPTTGILGGDAVVAARNLIAGARSGVVSVAAGETTVRVVGENPGGRNQHAALTAAIELEGVVGVFAALGTDGRDGSTDAAGAIVDGETCHRIKARGLDPALLHQACDSHRALAASGDLLVTGPTGTNVADLWMVWRR